MNIRNVKRVLPLLLKHNICPFIWGSQGIGKTESLKQLTKELGIGLVVLHLSTQEPGDLLGLPTKDEVTGKTVYARPEWLPTEGRGIIFLDEFNRAPKDVHQVMFPFVQEGRIHTHQLPPGWKVVAAGNYQSDRFDVASMSDSALTSRFCHIDFTPTVEEWLIWAESEGFGEMADFIREQPSMLEMSAKDAGRLDMNFITPDRRGTIAAAKIQNDPDIPEDLKYEIHCGITGIASAAAFVSHKSKKDKALKLSDITGKYLNPDNKVRTRVQDISRSAKEVRFDLLNQPIDELLTRLEANPEYLTADKSLDNIKQYFLDIPRELAMKAFSRLTTVKVFHGRDAILNDPEYVKAFA